MKMTKKKNTSKRPAIKILEDFNPVVPCAWLPDHEIRRKEYVEMITSFVQKHLKEKWDAKPLHSEESSDRS